MDINAQHNTTQHNTTQLVKGVNPSVTKEILLTSQSWENVSVPPRKFLTADISAFAFDVDIIPGFGSYNKNAFEANLEEHNKTLSSQLVPFSNTIIGHHNELLPVDAKTLLKLIST